MREGLEPIPLASFALQGNALGVPLPAGRFDDPLKTLTQQWSDYIKACCGHSILSLGIRIRSGDNEICADIYAEPGIATFRLKPMIEQLNAAKAGMGWFVHDAVKAIGDQRIPIYLPSTMLDLGDYLWFQDCSTDAEFASRIREEEGGKKRTLAQLKEEYSHPWPSDLDAAVDGHTWMLGRHYWPEHQAKRPKGWRKPRVPSKAEAKAFAARADVPEELRRVVADAIGLLEDAKKKSHPLADIGHLNEDELAELYGHYDEYIGRIGAMCFVAWDDPEILHEAVSHFEELEMQSSESCEVHFVIRAPHGDEAATDKAVKQLKAVVQRFALASKLLSHFNLEEED
jgi:PRTRC genetic system protein F